MGNRTCGECALMQHSGGVCPIFKTAIPAGQSACMMFATELNPCQICGNHMTPPSQLIDMTNPDKMIKYCRNCKNLLNHCQTCKNAQTCAFETDPSPLPKVVQREIRQGNMVTVTQVKNPSRIAETCEKKCPCFSKENGCEREVNYCGKYDCIIGGKNERTSRSNTCE